MNFERLARWLPHLWATSQLPPKKRCNWVKIAYKMCMSDITIDELRALFIALKSKRLTSPEWLIMQRGKWMNYQRIIKENAVKIEP